MSSAIAPGFMVLHSHRLENLRDVVLAWVRAYPIGPMAQERVLVQSNGMAQWLKAAMAAEPDADVPGLGICAGVQTDFAARFFWQMYRVVLGADAVPKHSPFDKSSLRWRLLRLLPELVEREYFEPLKRYLHDDSDGQKRWQLACQLADLYDQYQVYRGDWLMDWRAGHDQLRLRAESPHDARELAEHQRWQAELWRLLNEEMSLADDGHRAAVHERFIQALAGDARPVGLPERIIVWGFSTLPTHYLDALAALARHCQVVLTVLNPCQYYWADLLKPSTRGRHARKASLPLELATHEVAQHANPLLLAWGQQGRDYVGLLEQFDQPENYRPLVAAIGQRIDIFDETPADTLLTQIQQQVLNLTPLPEAPEQRLALVPNDASLCFQTAHSRLREVEALKDYLLDLLDTHRHDPVPLRPQDIAVMVPDIRDYAALIEATFSTSASSTTAPSSERQSPNLPYTLLDRPSSSTEPMLTALAWLMHLPESRCTATEIWDLLDVPAVRRRFALKANDIAELRDDFDRAGARWGLDSRHRETWGVPANLAQNTWQFALDRLLLGFASGEQAGQPQAFDSLMPSGRRGATEAQRLGPMARLLTQLSSWSEALLVARQGSDWVVLCQQLLADFFDCQDDGEKLLMQRVQNALEAWQQEMQISSVDGFELPLALPLAVVREAWLARLDEASMSQRFLTGNVHVATLMPMRAIPFRVVCLLGLNDNEFPRRHAPNDFDLLHAPKLSRPGDRSRSADDRYLFLEAILSARSHVLISWVGRSARSNADKPSSLLVAQLRDYLYRGWQFSDASLSAITTEHALQPFSPRYFQGLQATSFAAMWRAANDYLAPSEQQPIAITADELGTRLPLSELMYFYRSPARYFYRQRLGVVFAEDDVISPDHEPFKVDHLVRHQSVEVLLRSVQQDQSEQALATAVAERVGRGEWPLAGFSEPAQAQLNATAEDIELLSGDWLSQRALAPIAAAYTQHLADGREFEVYADIHGVRENSAGQQILWVPSASKLLNDKGGVKRWEKLWPIWLQQLLLTLSGHPVTVSVLCPLGVIHWAPVELADAQIYWREIVQAWRDGQDHALAFDVGVATAYLTKPTARNKDKDQTLPCELAAREAYQGSEFGDSNFAPITKPPMAMLWPDYAALSASNELALYRDSLVSAMIYHIEPERREWVESSL